MSSLERSETPDESMLLEAHNKAVVKRRSKTEIQKRPLEFLCKGVGGSQASGKCGGVFEML